MPGPTAYLRPQAVLSADVPLIPDVERLRKLIAMTDAARGVASGQSGFELDLAVLRMQPADYQLLASAAVARANCDPLTQLAQPTAVVAGIERIADTVLRLGSVLKCTPRLIKHVTVLMEGFEPRCDWWGVSVELSNAAAQSLSEIVGSDLNRLLALLTLDVPKAALLLAVTGPAGSALQNWLQSATSQNKGVRLELVLWILPWVAEL